MPTRVLTLMGTAVSSQAADADAGAADAVGDVEVDREEEEAGTAVGGPTEPRGG